MDDSDVGAVDEQNDGGSFEGSSDGDFAEFSFVTECDSAVVDAVASDAWFGFCFGVDGCGFGS